MALLVSIQQAARNALAAWLTSELAGVADLDVQPRWLSGDRKLQKRITIIDAGPREIDWLQTEVLATAPVTGDATKLDVTWNFGFITQAIQLDVWTAFDVQRDDILARLDASLNKGAKGLGVVNADAFAPGIQLNLADGWAPGIVDFLFEAPDLQETAGSVGESEFRATYRGSATAQMVQVARATKLARVLLEARLYSRDDDTSDPPDATVIIPTTP